MCIMRGGPTGSPVSVCVCGHACTCTWSHHHPCRILEWSQACKGSSYKTQLCRHSSKKRGIHPVMAVHGYGCRSTCVRLDRPGEAGAPGKVPPRKPGARWAVNGALAATTVSRAWGPGWTEVAGDTDGHFIFLRTSRDYYTLPQQQGGRSCSLGSQVASGWPERSLASSHDSRRQTAGLLGSPN